VTDFNSADIWSMLIRLISAVPF